MFKDTQAFSGFSVTDLEATKEFYGTVLGVEVQSDQMGLHLNISGGIPIFVYPKKDHTPASFTILNFPVEDIDEALETLTANGVTFEHYEMTDEKGIARGLSRNMGPDIAWFKDPSGNILSILQQNP